MPDNSKTASRNVAAVHGDSAAPAAYQMMVLLGLVVLMFWPEFARFARIVSGSGDWAHGLVAPVLILVLVHRRRRELAAALTRGSMWGIWLLLAGLGLFAVFSWPFDYGYLREIAIVPTLAGAILATCGGRVLKLCLPMLLLLMLSIPLGPRVYSRLIIRPETATLAATRLALDQLPDVDVRLEGVDLDYRRGDGTAGTVALGEPRRGALLLVTYVAVGVFVVFARVRPFWQVVVLALAAGPIALLCNFARIFGWGVLSIYLNPDPTSPLPRAVTAVGSLILAYALFAGAGALLSRVFVDADDDPDGALEVEDGVVA